MILQMRIGFAHILEKLTNINNRFRLLETCIRVTPMNSNSKNNKLHI